MRQSVVVPLLVLAGCGSGSPVDPVPGDRVSCALDGKVEFHNVCMVERKGVELVVHRPDGGFRRFELGAGGAVAALDGADAVAVSARPDGTAELAIDGDRYRLRLNDRGDGDAAMP